MPSYLKKQRDENFPEETSAPATIPLGAETPPEIVRIYEILSRDKTFATLPPPIDASRGSAWGFNNLNNAGPNLTQGGISGVNVRAGNADIETLLTNALPKTKRERIVKAWDWANSDDFLGKILDLRKKFAAAGFSLGCSQTEEGQVNAIKQTDEQELASMLAQAKLKDMLRKINLEWNLTGVVKDLMLNWFAQDSMVLYWRVKQPSDLSSGNSEAVRETLPEIQQISALNPTDCDWGNERGENQLFYRLPDAIYNKINYALKEYKPQARDQKLKDLKEVDRVPQEWIDAVAKGLRIVALTHEQGHHWVVRTNGNAQDGFAWPSMYSIFLYLEMRRSLRDGDYATAYMMKHFLQHVKMGESITNGPMAGSKANWPDPKEIEGMHQVVSACTKTARLVTNHTVEITYVFPPEAMFKDGKYVKPEAAIMHWSNVVEVIVKGDGSTNSSGYIGLKRTITDLDDARNEVDQAFQLLFSHETIKNSLSAVLPPDFYVLTSFDQNVLKEPRQLLEELKFLFSSYIIGAETAMVELGRDPNKLRMDKRRDQIDNESTGVFEPLSQAEIKPIANSEGRPPNTETTVNADTRNQPTLLK